MLFRSTSLTPDYFKVEVSISEFYQYSNKKRDYSSTKFSLDTVKQFFLTELKKLGIFKVPILAHISERDDQQYRSEALFQGTYEFNLTTSDSVEMLYKSLSANMPALSLRRIKVTPTVTLENIKKAQIALEAIALERARADAQKFADSNKVSILKIDNYQLGFTKKERYDAEYLNGQARAFNITYSNPIYTLNVYYTFKLK